MIRAFVSGLWAGGPTEARAGPKAQPVVRKTDITPVRGGTSAVRALSLSPDEAPGPVPTRLWA